VVDVGWFFRFGFHLVEFEQDRAAHDATFRASARVVYVD
jgi:hypothetical protein